MEKIRLVSLKNILYLNPIDISFFFVKTLNTQIDKLRADCERLQQSNTDLQRQRDIIGEEKEDLQKDKIRQVKENERCIKVIENLENKISQLKTDVTDLREQFHKEKLTKDVLAQEKHVLCKLICI
jgi:chromosome segregation ATPase